MTIADAHARLSSTDALLTARRDLYRMVVLVLASPDPDEPSSDEMLEVQDSPIFRHAVRTALATGTPLGNPEIETAAAVSRACRTIDVDGVELPVVAAAGSNAALRAVHRSLGTEGIGFVTDSDACFDAVLADVRQAATRAARAYPPFRTDLLPHVAMVGALRPSGPEDIRIRSASLREHPGLVVVSTPAGVWETAEMLVHEAAHARFYDMVTVHDVLPPEPELLGPFAPSWRAEGTEWPIEQAFAAFHAYVALAELWEAIELEDPDVALSDDSLLTVARPRADEIGAWLHARVDSLGSDAVLLLDGLLGHRSPSRPAPEPDRTPDLPETMVVAPGVRVRFERTSSVAVASRPGRPPEVFVLGRESGRVLSMLAARHPVEAAVHELSADGAVSRTEALERVHGILRALTERNLVHLPTERDHTVGPTRPWRAT